MKDKFKKWFTSDIFYKIISVFGNFIVDVAEGIIKQWLGTVVGQRFFKWFTDKLTEKFFDQTIRVWTMVGTIRAGYMYDDSRADRIVIRLLEADEANDEDLYMRTLNDALRGLPNSRT